MRISRVLVSILILSATVLAARADEPKATPLPAPVSGPATVFSFGKENPDCGEWTDACRVCIRGADGAPHCSTPGIACTPGAPVCRARKAP